MRARSTVAQPLRVLAAVGALYLTANVTLADSEADRGARGSVRARAEELAEEASRRFAEVLKGQRQVDESNAPHARADAPLALLWRWIEVSDRAYEAMMRRLSQRAEAAAPAEAGVASGEVDPGAPAGDAESGGHWVRQLRARLSAMLQWLSEGARPFPRQGSVVAAAEQSAQRPSASDRGSATLPVQRTAPVEVHPRQALAQLEAKEERPLAERRRAGAPASAVRGDPAPNNDQPSLAADAKAAAKTGTALAADRAAEDAERAQWAAAQRGPKAGTAGAGQETRTVKRPMVRAAGPAATGAQREAALARPPPHGENKPKAAATGAASAKHADRLAVAAGAPKKTGRRRRSSAFRTCEAAGTGIAVPGWYVVKQGDTLWNIARHHYGTGRRYPRIAAANRRRLHGHRIHPCQRLYLPSPRAAIAHPPHA